jgi:hypothetical protein
VVLTTSGVLVHSETFTHAVRDLSSLLRYQIVCDANGIAKRIAYEAPAPMSVAAQTEVRRRLASIDASLAEVTLVRVESLAQSVAGKSPMVIKEV